MITTMHSIERFLDEPAIAIVGASRSGRKFGNTALRVLRDKGYRVYPIHQWTTEIDGVKCYAGFAELPERVNAVLIVVPPAGAVDVVRKAAAAGIRHVWLQQGAESPEALRLAAMKGMNVIAGECVLMFASPAGIHKAHWFIQRIAGRLPA